MKPKGKRTLRVSRHYTPTQRLRGIANILEGVDFRCMVVDGPVTPTRQEITDNELRAIYLLATGKGY